MSTKPLEIDVSKVPLDKREDPRFVAIFNRLRDLISNDDSLEEICTHEGAHLYYFTQSGLTEFRIEGPFISYDAQNDTFDFSAATTRAVKWGEAFTNSDPYYRITRMAVISVAGEIATLAILNRGAGTNAGDRERFKAFCESMGEIIWTAAQDAVRKDLKNPAIQSAIRLVAEEVKRLLLEPTG
jgi:hypothetical protein